MIVINNHRIEEHREFILEQLIPLIVGHARNIGSPSEAVTLASFFALATILQAEGISRSALLQAIDTARLTEREASEVLH